MHIRVATDYINSGEGERIKRGADTTKRDRDRVMEQLSHERGIMVRYS